MNHLHLFAALLVYATLWYMIALWLKRNDVADIAWGLGFVLLAWLTLFPLAEPSTKALAVTTLVTVWGVRLSVYLFFRVKSTKEDFRYRRWREEWKYVALRSYLQVFILQAVFLFIIALPVIHINTSNAEFSVSDPAGLVLWIAGFSLQVIGDYQLKKFKGDPANRGTLLTTGVWSISRHPNYLGEVLMWWGIYLLAVSAAPAWWLIASPILITYLIRYVSGVPMLEKKYEGRPDFEVYKAKTPIFFPWKLPSR